MACNASRFPFLLGMTKRGFAAKPRIRPVGTPGDIETCALPNNIVVATAPAALPVTRVSVVFRGGARYESYENLGANHILRIAAGLSTKHRTAFNITRNLQQVGGNLIAHSDRELVTWTIETTHDDVELALQILGDVIKPAFKPWEISDSAQRIKTQLGALPKSVRAVELLHKAAFRKGLGNSLYIEKHRIGKISSESLLHYYANTCTASRCAIVGVGIDQNTLSGFAQSLELPNTDGKKSPSTYYGGEIRKDKNSEHAYVAVGAEAQFENAKDALCYAILEKAIAPLEPALKYSKSSGSLANAVATAAGERSATVNALNAIYSDNGLFGFVVRVDAKSAGRVIEAAVKNLKSGSVTADEVNRGKAQLKSQILEAYTTDCGLLCSMGKQAALCRGVDNAKTILTSIDTITPADVQGIAKKFGSSKLSMGAVGNLANVPYVSDLC